MYSLYSDWRGIVYILGISDKMCLKIEVIIANILSLSDNVCLVREEGKVNILSIFDMVVKSWSS